MILLLLAIGIILFPIKGVGPSPDSCWYLSNAMQMYNGAPEAFLIAGDCALNLKDFARAMNSYQTIRERYPKHPMAHDVLYYVGTAAYKLEKFDQARQSFAQLYKQYPGHKYAADAQYFLAWTYFSHTRFRHGPVWRPFLRLLDILMSSDNRP